MDRQHASQQLHLLQYEFEPLRKQLATLQQQKEAAFAQKEALKQKVQELGNQLKQFRIKRNQQISGVKDARHSRDEARKQVQILKEHLKALRQQKSASLQKQEFRGNPETLKQKIEKLELSIETEGYDYDKEQRVMEYIKKLKAAYLPLAEIIHLNEQIQRLQLQLKDALDKHTVFSSVVQRSHLSKEEYKWFRQLLSAFEQVKKAQEEAFAYFIAQKNAFNALRGTYKEKHNRFIILKKQLGQEMKERQDHIIHHRKKKEATLIAEKAKAVEEKWRTGKKLTTQDLIALQGKV
ncbi:MAG: hypothetical protein AABX86_02050 [Nanoarchaeota archaeon]